MGAKTSKRLAILVVLVGIFGVGAYFARIFQVNRMAQSMVARAEIAEQSGKLPEAMSLYQQHLRVVPNDNDVKLKYADVLLKISDSPAYLEEASLIYAGVLDTRPNRDDIRRKLATIAAGLRRYQPAESNLAILLQKTPDDGELEFLMGQCREALGNEQEAEKSYRGAILHSPQRVEAYSSLARLLRDGLKRPKEADEVIDSMVKAQPNDYRTLLARGRYRRPFDVPAADADFQNALRAKPDDPEIYVELAKSAQQRKNFPEARRILEDGLKKAGESLKIYQALVELGQASKEVDQAIADLRRGIKAFPNQLDLRWALANMFIAKGDPVGLLEQIEELKLRNFQPFLVDFLTANHHVMTRDWSKGRQLLSRLQGDLERLTSVQTRTNDLMGMKAKTNELLAKCLGELGDVESQEAALRRAVANDPGNLTARLELVQKLVSHGDIDQAIAEYNDMSKTIPLVWSPMARLMIYRAVYMRTADQNWAEIEDVINRAEKRDPASPDPLVMRSEMFLARGRVRDSQALLDQARRRFPKSLSAWTSLIGLTAFQLDKPDEALNLLDQAGKELGDRFELRLERARILSKIGEKGSETLAKSIEDLADNSSAIAVGDRRKLIEGLAYEALRAKCNGVATRLFQRCAEDEPMNLMLHWKLLNLAFQANDRAAIEHQIAEIKRIEGNERLMGTYADSWYLAWQAEQPDQSADRVAKLRSDARSILDELTSRRPDWSVIPLAYATLEEQDLKEQTDDAARIRIRDSLVNHYLQAINGGQRDMMIVRRAVGLLFDMRRYDDADQLFRKLSPATLDVLTPDLKQMSGIAVRNQDYEGALEIARKSAAARPEDFRELLWLAEMLRLSGKIPDAELELRKAVKLAGNIADPWVVLVQFLTRTDQVEKAEAALVEAQKLVPRDQIALMMAQGQESLSQAYEAKGKKPEAKLRADEAKKWYLTAEAEKPNDPRVRRLIAAFFQKNGQFAEVQSRLQAILQDPAHQEVTEVSWARRTLALTLLSTGRKEQLNQALDLFKDRANTLPKLEDRRVLVQVLLAQKDKEYTAEAIAALQSLVDKKEAAAEDRMLLAQLYRQSDDWPKARDQYRDLLALQPDNKTCLSQYASELISRIKPGSTQDAEEAERLIARLKQLEADWMNSYVLTLETNLFKAQGQTEKLVALINTSAARPRAQVGQLALLCEKLGQLDLAEKLLRSREAQSKPKLPRATLDLAAFLGRNGRLKEAIDTCEKAMTSGADPEDVARVGVNALFMPKSVNAQDVTSSAALQLATLIENGIRTKPQSTMLLAALGNVRERQQRYEEAIGLYQRVIELGSKDGIPLNNLAWLTALRGGQGQTALDLINRAIGMNGPIPDFLDTRGVAYMAAGDNRLAIEDLEKAVEADSSSPSKLVHLAQAYSKAGDKEKAKQCLEKAKVKGLETNSLHPLEMKAYRRLLEELGTHDAATKPASVSSK